MSGKVSRRGPLPNLDEEISRRRRLSPPPSPTEKETLGAPGSLLARRRTGWAGRAAGGLPLLDLSLVVSLGMALSGVSATKLSSESGGGAHAA